MLSILTYVRKRMRNTDLGVLAIPDVPAPPTP